ncbi:MAG: hybrid sensor histidine kinase/response regulator [Ignavibacteriaceae bacterium]|nr:hybrid sensor histidine kinase/response regulator [Ignavibacteriaceae bacterium]
MDRIKKKILLIDDVEENIIVLRERLEKEGYRTITANDGKTGIELALKENPDLILCDIMMPLLNGYEVMSIIHSNPRTNTIPFIFLTAKAEPKDFREGMQLGADDYITKPFDSKQLIKAVETRLARKETFEAKTEELKQSITYVLPQELKTPLAAIMGFSHLLIEDYSQIERKRILEIAEDIQLSAKRLNKLIQKILFSAKLDLILKDPEKLRELKTHKTENPNKLITETAVRIALGYDRVDDLEFEIDNTPLQIAEAYLKSIISELTDNAMKYSSKGTNVKITGVQKETEYCIYIVDNGKGISDKQIGMLGEFMQFDKKDSEQSGSGLGLSIVKKLILLYGGELNIESIPKKQTMVKLTIMVQDNGNKE